MKKYSILIALLLMSLKLFSQNTEPAAFEFTYGTHTSPQVINPNDFLQTKILFGFQWKGSKNMHDAIGCLCSSRHFKLNAMMSIEKLLLSFYYVDGEICKINKY